MKIQEVKKRRWVLVAATVFLVVMLILLFFSNHIMNRSLPEVAVRHAESGTITARIRGTGTVVANETFEVIAAQRRTVHEVGVRRGDEVSLGDVLIVFEGDESEELNVAREALHSLEVELERMLIESPTDDTGITALRRALQDARDSLADAERVRNAIPFSATALSAAQTAFNNANSTLSTLRSDQTRIQTNIDRLAAQIQPELDRLESIAGDIQNEIDALLNPFNPENAALLESAQNRLEGVRGQQTAAEAPLVDPRVQLAGVVAQLEGAERTRDEAQATLTIQQGHQSAWNSADSDVTAANRNVTRANQELTDALAQDGREDPNHLIDIREKERAIELKRQEVETLERAGGGSEITSQVYGVVAEIEISAGNTAEPGASLMSIEVVDRGYSLTFTAPAEQAARLAMNDNAEVDRGFFWIGDDVRATLTGIRNDPQNPRMNRILVFDISGTIESGTQLNLSIGRRSEQFETIVPNNAIRTDANGDFVLVIEPRRSPLGNRYFATRVDVNIIASDDTHKAVSGGLQSWDMVITTATSPIEPGMQVRLVDN